MLILRCPYCNENVDETDLHAGGEAHLKRYGPFGTYPAQSLKPPQEILDKISAKRQGWSWRELS